jgi:FKBP-type peptidyl-prolyl cis-trans isomerase
MRRATSLVLPVTAVAAVAAATLAGCSAAATQANPDGSVRVTGGFGQAPVVHIPAVAPGKTLAVRTSIAGHGPVVGSTDSVLANLAVYLWHGRTHRLLDSSFGRGDQVLPAQPGLPGLNKALRGLRAGSRVVAVLPPRDGFGPRGNPNIGVGGTDTTVWVIDVVEAFSSRAAASGAHVGDGGGKLPKVSTPAPGQAPAISVPKAKPPASLVASTLIKGTGAPLAQGHTAVIKYVGPNWRNATVFQSNWISARQPNATPLAFRLLPGQVVPGMIKGLTGVPVGSRVMLVIPPADGYGQKGNPNAGIKSSDTMVFVVDVLASAP